MSTDSLMAFAQGLAGMRKKKFGKMLSRKRTELQIQWDLNPRPLLFVHDG